MPQSKTLPKPSKPAVEKPATTLASGFDRLQERLLPDHQHHLDGVTIQGVATEMLYRLTTQSHWDESPQHDDEGDPVLDEEDKLVMATSAMFSAKDLVKKHGKKICEKALGVLSDAIGNALDHDVEVMKLDKDHDAEFLFPTLEGEDEVLEAIKGARTTILTGIRAEANGAYHEGGHYLM